MPLFHLKRWRSLAFAFAALGAIPGNAAPRRADTDLGGSCHEFDSCSKLFENHQDDYELARRLYELGASLPPKQVHAKMQALRNKLPGAHYLLVVEGHLHWGNHPDAARKLYEQARRNFKNEKNLRGEAVAVLNLAILEAEFGNFREAGALHDELEALSQRAEDRYTKVFALTGVAYYRLERDTRLGQTYRSLRAIDHVDSLPTNLRILFLKARSKVAATFEDFRPAEADLVRAIELARSRQDRYHAASCSAELSRLYLYWIESGASPDTRERIEAQVEPLLRHSLEVGKDLERTALVALSRWALAMNFRRRGENQETSMKLLDSCMGETLSGNYQSIYALCAAMKSKLIANQNPQAALKLAQAAFEILGRSNLHGERVESWTELVDLSWRLMDPKLAYVVSGAALSTIEVLRRKQHEELARMRIFSTRAALYQDVARRILSKRDALDGAVPKALEVLDRSRARTLVESAEAKFSADADSNSQGVKESYKKLRETMNDLLLLARRRYSEDPAEQERHRIEEQGLWSAQLGSLRDAVGSFQAALGLSQARTTVHPEKVQELLDKNEALVTYALGGSRHAGKTSSTSYAIVITSKKSTVVPLSTLSHGQLANLVETYRGRLLSPDAGDAFLENKLRTDLLDPLLDKLDPQIQNIVVVPDGALSRLPFSGLDSSRAYSFAPSLRYWIRLREARPQFTPKAQGLAVVDPRLESHGSLSASRKSARVTRSWRNLAADESLPLPQSRREAAAISKEIGERVQTLSGADASRENFLSAWNSSSNLLHLATHALVDEQKPKNSGLVLARGPDRGQANTNLLAGEIETLDLSGALVVLSGCATASGKSVSGEGVLSIARAFQRGGATAVVASLWPVYDSETADFFERFYSHLSNGVSVGQSLYRSQQELKEAGYPESSYSAFVVLGDASVRFQKQAWRPYWWLLSLCPLALLFFLRRRASRS